MKRLVSARQIVIGAGVVVMLVLGAVVVRIAQHQFQAARQAKATYYCPMHPTYTSDRPGDCPICNMRLVKRQVTSAESKPRKGKTFTDICYLHNCPKVHEGRPCPMLVVAKEGEQVTCPICGTHVAEAAETPRKKILYWTDPMIPGYKSDKPGKSPMGMDLVPVYEEEAPRAQAAASSPEGYAPILVTPQKQQLIGVITAPAQRRMVTKTIRTVGRVQVDETRIVHVHPKVEGWIDEIYARYEGDTVTRGQPLFSFYSPDFIATQEEYLAARETSRELPTTTNREIVAAAKANVDAARQRLLWWDVTEDQVQELEKRGTAMRTLVLTSPIDGVVLRKHVFPGEYMERGADFYHLADLSSVWVDADLYEYDLPLVRLGQEALVSLPNDATQQFLGKVVYVAPVLNAQTRTATARLEFPNPKGILRPGMYVTAQIVAELGERLVVPETAVLDTGTRKVLFVDKGQGLFEPRDVTVGTKADGYDEVTSGVSEGEQVVASGNFLIDSESRLKAALEGLTGGEHQHGQ